VSAISSTRTTLRSAMVDTLKRRGNPLLQSPRFGEPHLQLLAQCLELLRERHTVILGVGSANIAPRRQHVTVFTYIGKRGRLAEAGLIGIGVRMILVAPTMVGSRDLADVVGSELAAYTIHHEA